MGSKKRLTKADLAVMNMKTKNKQNNPLFDKYAKSGPEPTAPLCKPAGWYDIPKGPNHRTPSPRSDVVVSLQTKNNRVRVTFRNGVLGNPKPTKLIAFPDIENKRLSFYSTDTEDAELLQYLPFARNVRGETRSNTFPIVEFAANATKDFEGFMGRFDNMYMYEPSKRYGASFGGYVLLEERKDRKKGEKL